MNKIKTTIKIATYYIIDSNDEDLSEYECGHYSSFDSVCRSIVTNKLLSSKKFKNVNFDDKDEFEYYLKIEERFQRLLKYYLNPDKKQ